MQTGHACVVSMRREGMGWDRREGRRGDWGKGRGWYGMGWHGMGWDGMQRCGVVWYGIGWYGMGWYVCVSTALEIKDGQPRLSALLLCAM